MSMTDDLKQYNVNLEDAMERFMGNAALYEQMLKKFPAAVENRPVLEFIDSGDYKTAEENAHSIKGVSGNLSLTDVYNAYTDIVNLLRGDKPEEAKARLAEIIPVQNKIVECIRGYMD